MNQPLLAEFENEMQTTRRCLANVPTEKMSWTPHPKSMPMGRLASHIADMVDWASEIIANDVLDIAPPGGEPREMKEAASTAELLQIFDKNLAAAVSAIAAADDETLLQDWTFKYGGKPLMTIPRIASLRGFVLSHIIHHRGQLSVYLRLNDIPVPSIYGPSADDAGPFA
jgi:uncharacterized damage-inducible protein DinB